MSYHNSRSFRRKLPNRPFDTIKITTEHPELDVNHIARVIVRKGLKPVEAKRSISLRVDAEVLAWFQAQGPGYQTRMNAVLKAFKDASL